MLLSNGLKIGKINIPPTVLVTQTVEAKALVRMRVRMRMKERTTARGRV